MERYGQRILSFLFFTMLIVMDWLVRANLSSLALERLKFTLPMEIGILPLAGLEAEEGLEPDRAF